MAQAPSLQPIIRARRARRARSSASLVICRNTNCRKCTCYLRTTRSESCEKARSFRGEGSCGEGAEVHLLEGGSQFFRTKTERPQTITSPQTESLESEPAFIHKCDHLSFLCQVLSCGLQCAASV